MKDIIEIKDLLLEITDHQKELDYKYYNELISQEIYENESKKLVRKVRDKLEDSEGVIDER